MRTSIFLAGALMLLALNSCAVVGGIFKAGVWVGVLGVVLVVVIIVAIVSRARK